MRVIGYFIIYLFNYLLLLEVVSCYVNLAGLKLITDVHPARLSTLD
jgi:hypothetical protein